MVLNEAQVASPRLGHEPPAVEFPWGVRLSCHCRANVAQVRQSRPYPRLSGQGAAYVSSFPFFAQQRWG